jgi:8-oxo-dGTP pyrophosphatase MutT (NUDIX family)
MTGAPTPKSKPDPAPRPASTVLLMRDSADGIEVLMVTRNVESDFASGALVFPGGRVDASDGEPALLGRARLVAGLDAAAMAFRIAGIRETFEEAHMLLARPIGGSALLSAAEVDALESRLRGELGREPLFADLAASGSIELATDLLVPYAHWITPEGRPKRYDTQFFLIPAPLDQVAAHDGHEAVDNVWITPAAAIEGADAKKITLVFATRLNLAKLDRSRSVAEALTTARESRIVTVCPELLQTPEGLKLRIPAEADYGLTETFAAAVTRA